MNTDTLVVVAFALLVLLAIAYVFLSEDRRDQAEEANDRKLKANYDRQMQRRRDRLAAMGDEESRLEQLFQSEDKPKRKPGRPRKVA